MTEVNDSMIREDGTEELSDDKQQRIAALEEEVRTLRDRIAELEGPNGVPEKLSTRESVLKAIENHKIDYYDLAPVWKNDVEIVCATFRASPAKNCLRNSFWLNRGADCPVRFSDLPYQLMVNKEVVLAALASRGGPGWKQVPAWLKHEPDIIATALMYKKIRYEDVPDTLRLTHRQIALIGVAKDEVDADDCDVIDRNDWKTAIECKHIPWSRLPSRLRTDPDFARDMDLKSMTSDLFGEVDSGVVRDILQNVAVLRHDASYWQMLLSIDGLDRDVYRLLGEFAPHQLVSDSAFMINMCRGYAENFSHADRSLVSDEAFLADVLAVNVEVLKCFSHETQLTNLPLLLKALPILGRLDEKTRTFAIYQLERAIAPALWDNMDFVRAWIKARLGFPDILDGQVMWQWGEDREICLANATLNGNLDFTPEKWLENEDFMMTVIDGAKNPDVYANVYDYARSAPVGIAAFAASPDFTAKQMLKYHIEGQDEIIEKAFKYVRRHLHVFETFSECVLLNMCSTKTLESTGTPLSLLNQGLETSLAYKKNLAEFIGLPTGKWLRQLRQAEHNICQAVAPWAPNLKDDIKQQS